MSEVAKQWWPSTLYEGGGDNEPDNGLGSLSFVWESVAEGETPSLTIPVTCSDGLQYSTNGGKTWKDVERRGQGRGDHGWDRRCWKKADQCAKTAVAGAGYRVVHIIVE